MLIIGCGNLLRGDDGLGIHLIKELGKLHLPENVKLIDAGTISIDMLFQMEAVDKVIIVDAVEGGLEPGNIYRLTKEDLASPSANPISLHELKLEHTLKIGEKILGDKFPSEIIIFGVEVGEVKESIALSPKVEKSLPRLIDLLLREL